MFHHSASQLLRGLVAVTGALAIPSIVGCGPTLRPTVRPGDAGSERAVDAAEARDGLYRCGPQRLGIDDADDYHSVIPRWWRITRGGFRAYSTCSRDTTIEALERMNAIGGDLARLFGRAPEEPSTVILLRSREQYNGFAVTQAEIGELPPDSMGWAAFHYAFPCDRWLDRQREFEHPGAACAYWDARTDAGRAWGAYAARHAAAQAFVESIDPSPVALAKFRLDPGGSFPSAEFWGEKRVPLWLRYGAATWCERFGPGLDPSTAEAVRSWTLGELERRGGPLPLDDVFAFALDPTDGARSTHLMISAGALVAFLVGDLTKDDAAERPEGRDEVVTALGEFQRSLLTQAPTEESRRAAQRLESALRDREAEFRELALASR